jgi:hypothetical protein
MMDGCIYRTKDGECDLYSEGGKYHAWCDMNGCDGRRMSNADRIRAMTDEELAEWLERIRQCCSTDSCRITSGRQCPFTEVCYSNKETLDWLKQEAE